MSKPFLSLYVVYDNPRDFPGEFVVRIQHATAAGVEVEPALFARGPSLESVREQLPQGLYSAPPAGRRTANCRGMGMSKRKDEKPGTPAFQDAVAKAAAKAEEIAERAYAKLPPNPDYNEVHLGLPRPNKMFPDWMTDACGF